jgi:hypothetical protein
MVSKVDHTVDFSKKNPTTVDFSKKNLATVDLTSKVDCRLQCLYLTGIIKNTTQLGCAHIIQTGIAL